MESLPKSFQYINVGEKSFRCNIKTFEEAQQWIKEYSAVSKTCWINKYRKKKVTRYVSHDILLCHHSVGHKLNPSERKLGKSKNLFCKAELDVLVKKVTANTIRFDKHLKNGYPTIIKFSQEHNHSITDPDALSRLRPTVEVKDKFFEYFDEGLNVVESMKAYKKHLQLKYKNCKIDMADASINPKKRSVIHWYDKWTVENLGPISENDMSMSSTSSEQSSSDDVNLETIPCDSVPICDNLNIDNNTASSESKVVVQNDEDISNVILEQTSILLNKVNHKDDNKMLKIFAENLKKANECEEFRHKFLSGNLKIDPNSKTKFKSKTTKQVDLRSTQNNSRVSSPKIDDIYSEQQRVFDFSQY